MAKPPKKKAPKKKAAKPAPEPTSIDTDAPRQGPLGERRPPTEADLIAAAANEA